MPEGPEVRTIVDDLNAVEGIIGLPVRSVDFLREGRYSGKEESTGLPAVQLAIKAGGFWFRKIGCHGKFIWWMGEDSGGKEYWFSNTLGMTGSWSYREDPYSHFGFKFQDSEGPFGLFFSDIRRFGTFQSSNKQQIEKKINSLGIDLLENSLKDHTDRFLFLLKKFERKNICVALMDQSLISGVGNYIKSESLYRTAISPLRRVSSLSSSDRVRLFMSVKDIMEESYALRGCSLRDYVDVKGNEGKFSNYLRVYGRKEDSFGNEVKKLQTPDGRSTWWVPEIQL